jgi:hypothetical protein
MDLLDPSFKAKRPLKTTVKVAETAAEPAIDRATPF